MKLSTNEKGEREATLPTIRERLTPRTTIKRDKKRGQGVTKTSSVVKQRAPLLRLPSVQLSIKINNDAGAHAM